MHKVIKIRGCHQCPYQELNEICCFPVTEHRKIVTGDEVKFHSENETTPDSCPLEEDNLHKITKNKIWELWKMVSHT